MLLGRCWECWGKETSKQHCKERLKVTLENKESEYYWHDDINPMTSCVTVSLRSKEEVVRQRSSAGCVDFGTFY